MSSSRNWCSSRPTSTSASYRKRPTERSRSGRATTASRRTATRPGAAAGRISRERRRFASSPIRGTSSHFPTEASPDSIEDTYRRGVLPLVLQLRGHEVLHASAVSTASGLLVLCGVSGTGKSTFAYGLSRRGYPLWADDAVVLDIEDEDTKLCRCRSGWAAQGMGEFARTSAESSPRSHSDQTFDDLDSDLQRREDLPLVAVIRLEPTTPSSRCCPTRTTSASPIAAKRIHARPLPAACLLRAHVRGSLPPGPSAHLRGTRCDRARILGVVTERPTAASKPVSRVRDLAGLLASPRDAWLAAQASAGCASFPCSSGRFRWRGSYGSCGFLRICRTRRRARAADDPHRRPPLPRVRRELPRAEPCPLPLPRASER